MIRMMSGIGAPGNRIRMSMLLRFDCGCPILIEPQPSISNIDQAVNPDPLVLANPGILINASRYRLSVVAASRLFWRL
jgi:hypothetical protein